MPYLRRCVVVRDPHSVFPQRGEKICIVSIHIFIPLPGRERLGEGYGIPDTLFTSMIPSLSLSPEGREVVKPYSHH